jgi:hypothetical protein
MFSKDIPIELINLALLAIIVTPIVLAVCIVWAINRVVRPLWALRDQLAHVASNGQPQESQDAQPLKVSPSVSRHVFNSAFGR